MTIQELALLLLRSWKPLGYVLLLLGVSGLAWVFIRRSTVESASPTALLRPGNASWITWILVHRRTKKFTKLSLLTIGAGLGILYLREQVPILEWCFERPRLLAGIHGGAVLAIMLLVLFWNSDPSFLRKGEGRADSYFRDIPHEWGRVDPSLNSPPESVPMAQLLVHRSPSRLACRLIGGDQRFSGHLTRVSLRWDILSRHLFLLGPQGSGKTSGFYAHLMLSARCPWIYQDSKAELPYRSLFLEAPVWGLDVRGHQSRSEIWNLMDEIESAEDFDLVVEYLFPVNPMDANPWVREMARVMFRAILESRRWASVQEISRTLRATRLEPFLAHLDPIWRDLMSEPKSQVPVLQDLVTTLSRWETKRISQITEGPSTVRLADFLSRGGYVMNNESSSALRAPVQVFWGLVQARLRHRAEGSSPILLLLDEFGDAGKIPDIENALVLLRSKGVAIVAAIQNMGLLQQVYSRNWQAVLQGFGTRIWLARNMEDDIREKLSRALGKWTRKVPPQSATSKETERDTDLMPLDAWGTWSEEGVALGRLHGFSYWLPVSIPIPAEPLGPVVEPINPWEQETAQELEVIQELADPIQLPKLPPPPSGSIDDIKWRNEQPEPQSPSNEDWL